MGTQETTSAAGGESERQAMQRVLRDLDALEHMLHEGRFETDCRRIGAEQELVLVDDNYLPCPVATDVLDRIDDGRVVPEIARFNLEYNCDPVVLGGDCLTSLQRQMTELFDLVRTNAAACGARPLLTGICPTVDLDHLSRDNITPRERYYALDETLRTMRGSDYELHIEGADELIVRHPSVMLEALNTSFQVHFQTTPDEFASAYNTALAIAAPVLAVGVNSPILFGKRLWQETRIAIFQQVVDTRSEGAGRREMLGRVRFGESWVRDSVLEILRSDAARFRQVLSATGENIEDPYALLQEGRIPKLKAFQTFNSCVYRWMRPCYGLTDGKPHLRIENRVLPAGPTIEDEIANAAFWIGLMLAGPSLWTDLTDRLDVRSARENFLRASRDGLMCHMTWLDGIERPTSELITETFVPAARDGLLNAGVDSADVERCLSTISERVESRQTGAQWMLRSVSRMGGRGTRSQRLHCLAKSMVELQDSDTPVHRWDVAELDEKGNVASSFATVSQCMSNDLFTVAEDDCIELVASIMDWERLRHVPVEDANHRLIGLVSYRSLLRQLARHQHNDPLGSIPVSRVMVRNPLTVSPNTPTLEALAMMREKRVSCLPVVEHDRLVGVVSERDYTEIAGRLLENTLLDGRS